MHCIQLMETALAMAGKIASFSRPAGNACPLHCTTMQTHITFSVCPLHYITIRTHTTFPFFTSCPLLHTTTQTHVAISLLRSVLRHYTLPNLLDSSFTSYSSLPAAARFFYLDFIDNYPSLHLCISLTPHLLFITHDFLQCAWRRKQ